MTYPSLELLMFLTVKCLSLMIFSVWNSRLVLKIFMEICKFSAFWHPILLDASTLPLFPCLQNGFWFGWISLSPSIIRTPGFEFAIMRGHSIEFKTHNKRIPLGQPLHSGSILDCRSTVERLILHQAMISIEIDLISVLYMETDS